ncbi:MAG TPA: hypothetical protein VNM90_07640, partial [Haliangium sp.]|nr:hypothetical protein [Haliangium sp.]
MTNVPFHVEQAEQSSNARPARASRESVEILGLGAWLPETVRTNEWWPRGVVQSWREHYRAQGVERRAHAGPTLDPSAGQARVAAAIARLAEDPFQGSRERRVLDEQITPSEMEARACQRALEKSGLAPSGIDFVLG